MKTKFKYKFKPLELFTFLFKDKVCPFCGGRLTEAKCFVLDSGACHYSKSSAPKAIQGRTIKDCFYVYSCKQCAAGLTLSDFTKVKGCKKKR